MKILLRMELEKAFASKWFAAALALGCVFAVGCAALYFPSPGSTFTPSPDKFYYPTSQGCFHAWISVSGTSLSLLFYQLLPLLAVVPYAWSLRSELKDGYFSQVCTRASRDKYLAAKFVAAVCAAGAVAVIPQLLNLVVLACIYPGYLPNIVYDSMYVAVVQESIGSWLFYNFPLGYVLLYCAIDFALCGLWAGFVLALSFLVRNRVVLLVAPYVFLILLQFVNERIFLALGGLRGFELGMFANLHGGYNMYLQNIWIIAAECLVLLALTVAIFLAKRKSDVL